MPAAALLDVVFFELRGLRCALPLVVLRKVLPMCGVTPVPLAPAVVRGVAPLQGLIVPVLDLAVCFHLATDENPQGTTFHFPKDKLLLVEMAQEAGRETVRAALAVENSVSIGTVDEQHSRPPPVRPTFLSATILDASGPALLLDMERTMNYVRDAIGMVIGP